MPAPQLTPNAGSCCVLNTATMQSTCTCTNTIPHAQRDAGSCLARGCLLDSGTAAALAHICMHQPDPHNRQTGTSSCMRMPMPVSTCLWPHQPPTLTYSVGVPTAQLPQHSTAHAAIAPLRDTCISQPTPQPHPTAADEHGTSLAVLALQPPAC